VEFFCRLGCQVLLVDYRGYGDNEGQPSELWQARDARRVWQFATETLHFAPEQVVIFGESIGGAASTRLAADLCRGGVEPAGLILQATFPSMLDVISQFFPRLLASIFLVDRYPSVRRIRHVTCPLLAIHGSDDRLIPIEMGKRLFAAAPAQSTSGRAKQFVELPGADHSDILSDETGLIENSILDFLQRVVPQPRIGSLPAEPLYSPLTPSLR